MNETIADLPTVKLLKIGGAVLVGLGIGTALKGSVALPALGTVPGLALGASLLLVGALVYTQGPRFVGTSGSSCGCEGDCGCM